MKEKKKNTNHEVSNNNKQKSMKLCDVEDEGEIGCGGQVEKKRELVFIVLLQRNSQFFHRIYQKNHIRIFIK